ncbi:MAG: hypothetical protein AAF519_12020 [Bacteroidota bacterium]
MNQFTERYKTFSNSDLLRVIDNQSDYQPEAVEAAKTEIDQRNLSDQEMTEAKDELETERQKKQKLNEKRAEVEQKVKTIGTSIFDTINPIQKSAPTAEKLIRLITIVFGLITVVKWYNELGLVKFMLTDDTGGWDLSMIEYFLPLILLPAAVILFWLRKKSGWILMAVYLTYSAISAFGLIIMTWNMEPLGIPALDSLFPQTSSTTQILTTLFFGVTLWVMTKKEIKEHYDINRQTMIAAIGIAAVSTILFIAPFLLT